MVYQSLGRAKVAITSLYLHTKNITEN